MHPSMQDHTTTSDAAKRPRTVEILVNTRPVLVPPEATGAQIKAAAGVPADFKLFRIRGHEEIPVDDEELLRVRHHERFIASPTLDPAFVSNQAHADAIATVRDAFPGHEILTEEADDGISTVTLLAVAIGEGWNYRQIDLAVKLQVTFPSSPPYPFYGPAGMARTDGRALPQIQPHVPVDGQARTQISLAKPFDSTIETLGARLVAVIDWLRSPR